jgi:ABC-2 type transport system permease protein
LAALAWNEFKMNLRDPLMAFWSLAFPTLWLVFNASIFPEPMPGFSYSGLNYASFLIPSSVSLVILCASFIGVPMTLTSYRETAVLRRFRVTPVRNTTLALAFSLSQAVFVATGVLILMVVGSIVFDVSMIGSGWAFAGISCLGMTTFLAIGSAIGSIASNAKTANIIIWTAFTPMLLLSELFIPHSVLPAGLRTVAKLLPLSAVNTLLRDVMYGVELTDLWRFAVIAGWIIVSAVTTAKYFRWE